MEEYNIIIDDRFIGTMLIKIHSYQLAMMMAISDKICHTDLEKELLKEKVEELFYKQHSILVKDCYSEYGFIDLTEIF